MKVLIDACVLYPTVLRELVIGLAKTGAFTPLWSERILEEWRRVARRNGEVDVAIAEGEIALLKAAFPDALVAPGPETEARLTLPDPSDIHVLAAAIDGKADALLTLNVKDFPTNTLSQHAILRRHPDEFLLEAYHGSADTVRQVVDAVLSRAAEHGIDTSNPRALLKRARLPRLAKALFA
ncbi:MAG: PIN domain-containing protein [Paracoccaceae bacterium]|nr:PIN domain-containing protein [Paracoccaceae bacterium]